jgi:hypothetical protein
MRVIIHIGLTKTGTSSFQRALDGERDLLARHDISFLGPVGLRPSVSYGIANAVARNDPAGVAQRWAKLEALAQDRPTMVISSENFQRATAAGIADLKRLLDQRFGNPDFTIYVGIRRWADRLVSLWQQGVRHSSPDALPAYVEARLAGKPCGHVLDIAGPIEQWSSVFGRQSMLVISMEQALEADGDVAVHAFKRLFGLVIPAQRYLANVSTIQQTELIRAINQRHANLAPPDRRAIIRSVLRFWVRGKPEVLEAARLIETRLHAMTVADGHPLFRQLEERSGHTFASRVARTWAYAPDGVFKDRRLESLVAKIDRKAVARAARVAKARAEVDD